MKITYLGLLDSRFKYSVELNGHNFDFSTGLGWVVWRDKNPDPTQYKALSPLEVETVIASQPRQSWTRRTRGTKCFRKEPTKADILECLKSDVEAGSYSFDEFCDNFGYSNDSIDALEIYRKCTDTAKKLRGYEWPQSDEETALDWPHS